MLYTAFQESNRGAKLYIFMFCVVNPGIKIDRHLMKTYEISRNFNWVINHLSFKSAHTGYRGQAFKIKETEKFVVKDLNKDFFGYLNILQFKGTVNVISSNPPLIKWYDLFTPVPF